MSNARLLFVACFLVSAVSVLASATAAVAAWDVSGSLLTGTAAIAEKAPVLSSLRIVAAGVEVICEGKTVDIRKGFIRHPDEMLAEELAFHECKVVNSAATNCDLLGPLISTFPIHGLAELDGVSSLNTLILILPLPSKTFAIFPFLGANCALLGNQPLTASKNPAIDLLIHDGGVSKITQLVLAFSLKESLKLGSNEAALLGLDFDIQLASGLPFAFL